MRRAEGAPRRGAFAEVGIFAEGGVFYFRDQRLRSRNSSLLKLKISEEFSKFDFN